MTDQLTAGGVDDADEADGASEAAADTDTDMDAEIVDVQITASASRSTWRERRKNRVSKWDRPPDPKDWRYFVGTAGKVLIATGLLLFGFVAYQLWGTGIETARAQNKLENEFETLIAEFQTSDDSEQADTPESDAANPAPTDRPSESETVADSPITDTEPNEPTTIELLNDGAIGLADAKEALADELPEPVDLNLPLPERGGAIAQLIIPSIDHESIVVAGVDVDTLKKGPGHYPNTPLPGQLGNASIAGHRTTFGAPFSNVDKIKPGDELIMTAANGDRFVYEVTFTEIVDAADGWVINTTDPDIAELTLTSCHPKYTAERRIVVHSLLNPAKSSNIGVPTFYDLGDDDQGAIPGDDPTITVPVAETAPPVSIALANGGESAEIVPDPAVDTLPSFDDDVSDDDVSEEPDEATAVVDDFEDDSDANSSSAPAAGTDDRDDGFLSEPAGQAEDAFALGWFDDREAFPQIALWGLLLSIISIGAYLISRRFRHDSYGFLAGIAPFMVALYFFFQNINRLLPPGL